MLRQSHETRCWCVSAAGAALPPQMRWCTLPPLDKHRALGTSLGAGFCLLLLITPSTAPAARRAAERARHWLQRGTAGPRQPSSACGSNASLSGASPRA